MSKQRSGSDRKYPPDLAPNLQFHIKLLLLNMMAFCIAGKYQCQCTVAGHVACSSEAVLQCKDGKHQCSAGAVEFQYSGDDAKGCHDGSSGNTGSSDGKDTQKKAEQNHGTRRGNGAVQDLRNRHTEENLCQDGATEMDVCKQRDPEADQILTEWFCLGGTLQCNGQCGCR